MIGDIWRVSCIWKRTTNGSACVNNWHWRQDTLTIFDDPAEDVWEAMQLGFMIQYQDIVTNLLALVDVRVSKAPDFVVEYTAQPTTISGTHPGNAMPPRTAGILSLRTDLISRRGRGRIFLPPPGEGFNAANGNPDVDYILNADQLADFMVNGIGDGLTTAQYTGAVWSKADGVGRVVTGAKTQGYWGTQRDRAKIFG